MLKIEIREVLNPNTSGEKLESVRIVSVNGITDFDAEMSISKHPTATFFDDQVIAIFEGETLLEIAKHFTQIAYAIMIDAWEDYIDLTVTVRPLGDEVFPKIQVDMQIKDWQHWAKPYSMAQFAEEIEQAIKGMKNPKFKYWQEEDDSVLNGFGFEFLPESLNVTLSSQIDEIDRALYAIINHANASVLSRLDPTNVLTYFQFPEEIKTACKQYLVYFAQFLSDVGISADTEIKEESNMTLFKIIPKDKIESLDKIRDALNIYLNAPNAQNFEIEIARATDPAAKQWEANIYFLKTQFALNRAISDAQQTTIENLKISNYQLNQTIQQQNAKQKDEEDVIPGVVAVRDYEGAGFKIKFAEIFRMLKRRFGK